eukprot:1160170-Pelagomonas_calceolata.AAC.1
MAGKRSHERRNCLREVHVEVEAAMVHQTAMLQLSGGPCSLYTHSRVDHPVRCPLAAGWPPGAGPLTQKGDFSREGRLCEGAVLPNRQRRCCCGVGQAVVRARSPLSEPAALLRELAVPLHELAVPLCKLAELWCGQCHCASSQSIGSTRVLVHAHPNLKVEQTFGQPSPCAKEFIVLVGTAARMNEECTT